MSAPVFELRGVGIRRDRRDLLADIDWIIRTGERWVVLGPNGAGKTTLVRILSTYLRASSGTVDVLGRRIGRVPVDELRPGIGYLSPALAAMVPGELTPRQLVDAAQAGAVVPWYVDRARIDPERTAAALAQVGLADAPERPFATFSSGEQLRVQLARAIVTDPAVLLLDEPMASLDIGGRETLVSTLASLAHGPIGAIVVVLHRLEDIPPGFTHALLLRGGRMVVSGPIDEIVADGPLSETFGTPLRAGRSAGRWSATT